ncbi:MAG: lytic transglycosylase domain-containing protein [Candidatus Gastranaerophilales bacterium]|nr:lytic transglycosylase domain-containing protein [Candidatus Gastranaerophilales bacterium]
MSINGLDTIINRMQYIERQFDMLSGAFNNVSGENDAFNVPNAREIENKQDFQQILNAKEIIQEAQEQSSENDENYIKLNGYQGITNVQRTNNLTNRTQIDELIKEYSQKYGLDSDFVKAVVKQESGFNEKATSKCGAMGLMQLMPGTAKALNVNDPYNARDNIEGGVKYLKGLMDRFGGDMKLALAAYNAGPNAVKKYNGIPPYNETQNYVKNIMSMYQRIQSGGEL